MNHCRNLISRCYFYRNIKQHATVQKKITNWSYISRPFKEHYVYKSVIDVFYERTKEFSDKEIFIQRFPDGTRKAITYTDLKIRAESVAGHLSKKGVHVGDCVGIFGPNSLEWVVGEVAILMTGASCVQIMKSPGSFAETLKFLQFADCKALLIDTDNDTELQQDMDSYLQKKMDSTGTCKPSVILLKSYQGTSLPSVESIYNENQSSKFMSQPIISPESTAIIFMTSGSTGLPKMIEHSHFTLVNTASSKSLSGLLDKECSGPYYNDMPFSWIGGTFIYNLMHGNPRVFRDGKITFKSGGAADLWKIFMEEKCASAFLLPFTIQELLLLKEDIKNTKFLLNTISTGGQMTESHLADVRDIICKRFIILYGSTEVSAVTEYDVKDPLQEEVLGQIYPGVQVKILGDDGYPVARGETGEICIRCHWMLQGYRKASAEQQKNVSGGWVKMGDIGIIQSNGELIIKGKAANRIKRNTIKILSDEVERCIQVLPGVNEVVVVGVPDVRVYEEVCACVILDKKVGITMNDVENHCKRILGDNITGDSPTYYLEYDSLPKLPTGKPDKVKIRKDAMQKLVMKA